MNRVWWLPALAGIAFAAPAQKTFSSFSQWARGEAVGVEVWSPGGVARGATLDSVEVDEEQFVWAACRAREGGVYLATGGSGRIYRFHRGVLTLVFDSPQSDLFCVAEDETGAVWAGSSPDGLVFRITSRGVHEYRTGQQAVWCIVPFRGGVAAGTGPEGRVFWCTEGGRIQEVARTSMRNVLSLLPVADDLMAAGDGPASVQRVTSRGEVITVAQLDCEEARSLVRLGEDSLALLAVGCQDTGSSTVLAGPLWGPLSELWSCPDSLALDMIATSDGLLVASGSQGAVYRVWDAQRFCRVGVDADPTCVAWDGERIFAGAGSPAKLYWLHGRARAATWRSPVLDAGAVADWGRVMWMGQGTKVTLRVRTGNLQDPSQGWSAWVDGRPVPGGWALAVPPGRFGQVELQLGGTTQGPAVEWLQVRYQPRNRPPAVGGLALLPRGQRPQGVVARNQGGDEAERYLVWQASDPDGDELEFTVWFSAFPRGQWVQMGAPTGDTHHLIPQAGLAEGWYRFRVVASDRPANHPRVAHQVDRVSDPLLLDDTPPQLRKASWDSSGRLRAVVFDMGSGVAQVAVCVDGSTWTPMEPEDGVVDAAEEAFVRSLPRPQAGWTLRLVDREGNWVVVSPPSR